MLLNHDITTTITITSLIDLHKLKHFEEESTLKVNKSALARELNVDRRTVSKYIDGYSKPSSKPKKSQFDDFYVIIDNLLNDELKVFAYKRVLWQYLKDNHSMPGAASSFRRYLSSVEKFDTYFKKKHSVKSAASMRYETGPGEQAQLDWKESIEFTLSSGEVILLNIFSLFLSYSRFRIYRISLDKTRATLLHLLNESFELFGGVPKQLVTDNMSTVMDVARTPYRKGTVNIEFQQFVDDYGFTLHPCIAGRPETKAKVESPMKILDEIKAYNGDLSYEGIVRKIEEINDRENKRYHDSYQKIPILGFNKEKDSLLPLPTESIRNQYSIQTQSVKVNASSMFSYCSNSYSVPPEYIGKRMQLQIIENKIHVYYNKKLITMHVLTTKKLNYIEAHYIAITKQTLPFEEEKIEKIAKENLRRIGEIYDDNAT